MIDEITMGELSCGAKKARRSKLSLRAAARRRRTGCYDANNGSSNFEDEKCLLELSQRATTIKSTPRQRHFRRRHNLAPINCLQWCRPNSYEVFFSKDAEYNNNNNLEKRRKMTHSVRESSLSLLELSLLRDSSKKYEEKLFIEPLSPIKVKQKKQHYNQHDEAKFQMKLKSFSNNNKDTKRRPPLLALIVLFIIATMQVCCASSKENIQLFKDQQQQQQQKLAVSETQQKNGAETTTSSTSIEIVELQANKDKGKY